LIFVIGIRVEFTGVSPAAAFKIKQPYRRTLGRCVPIPIPARLSHSGGVIGTKLQTRIFISIFVPP